MLKLLTVHTQCWPAHTITPGTPKVVFLFCFLNHKTNKKNTTTTKKVWLQQAEQFSLYLLSRQNPDIYHHTWKQQFQYNPLPQPPPPPPPHTHTNFVTGGLKSVRHTLKHPPTFAWVLAMTRTTLECTQHGTLGYSQFRSFPNSTGNFAAVSTPKAGNPPAV